MHFKAWKMTRGAPGCILGSEYTSLFHGQSATFWCSLNITCLFRDTWMSSMHLIGKLTIPTAQCSAFRITSHMQTDELIHYHTDFARIESHIYAQLNPYSSSSPLSMELSKCCSQTSSQESIKMQSWILFVHTSGSCLCCQATQKKCQRLLLVLHAAVKTSLVTVNLLAANWLSSATNTYCRFDVTASWRGQINLLRCPGQSWAAWCLLTPCLVARGITIFFFSSLNSTKFHMNISFLKTGLFDLLWCFHFP